VLSDMLSPLMPNARELVEHVNSWYFDEDSAADLALLNAIGVLGSMRESELALFFRGQLERVSDSQGHADDFAVVYPASNRRGNVTSDSAVHATRRRLLNLVGTGQLAMATTERTTEDNLAGRYYWLTSKGTRRLLGAGYRVRSRQNIDNMSHIGSVQDQHRLLEQQYLIARRLLNPSLRVWGEYAIRSGLARIPAPVDLGATLPTVKEQLVAMSAELFVTPASLGDTSTPNTEANLRRFTRRPDALVLDEQPERDRYRDATRGSQASRAPHCLGDVEWTEIEASKKDSITQSATYNALFYLGRMLDAGFERGKVTKVSLVTRNHPHADLRKKLLDGYEQWLGRQDVKAMLSKNAIVTKGFDPVLLNEQLWLTEISQDSEQRLTDIRMETVASILLREGRGSA